MVLIQEVLLCQSVYFCQNFLYSFSDLQSFVSILICFVGCVFMQGTNFVKCIESVISFDPFTCLI